ncbi:23S rRNA pseudouridine(2604) synthase RluF [Hydrocarboniclastica marina]|uniref:Pseudouridine synthase n=1 Tax=Hydrocarboniclastica marina TaxID=2259620 RepID=A0A4P7XH47_9ALTE|nr:23S rRNA pseudouridine(2604) synthase RluF [Hydrocarboniclastica marina]MAL98469.1 23S rRNA pseudouridine(2604) synthase RluF [Alteromonadaceae bacterium]QCF25774.1 23S rRNA pseudouridine(2604) synthase RluF [Hydrocarboniclastica marina]
MNNTNSGTTRLNKFISETGICSRREADRFIDEGRVRVNGRTAEMGMRVSPEDKVEVNGKNLRAKPAPVYIAFNKPVGITCTTDPEVPGNIIEAVRYRGRIFPIGRLDKPSEGLILLTNDGDIVNKILRAGNAHEKEYLVTVDRPVDSEFVQKMGGGLPVLGTVTQPCKVRQTSATSFNIILTQGLNRQIRRMAEYLGYNVTRLKRLRVMNIGLGKLKVGEWRELTRAEIRTIDAMIAGSSKTEEASGTSRSTKASDEKRSPGAPARARRRVKAGPGVSRKPAGADSGSRRGRDKAPAPKPSSTRKPSTTAPSTKAHRRRKSR